MFVYCVYANIFKVINKKTTKSYTVSFIISAQMRRNEVEVVTSGAPGDDHFQQLYFYACAIRQQLLHYLIRSLLARSNNRLPPHPISIYNTGQFLYWSG
jgi:hypothetical protein